MKKRTSPQHAFLVRAISLCPSHALVTTSNMRQATFKDFFLFFGYFGPYTDLNFKQALCIDGQDTTIVILEISHFVSYLLNIFMSYKKKSEQVFGDVPPFLPNIIEYMF